MANLYLTGEESVEPDKQRPKRCANAHSWKKGHSGNPRGRPPGNVCITSIAKHMLGEPAELPENCPEFMKGWNWAQLIAYNMIKASGKPIAPVLAEFLNRTEGKVPQPITGETGGPVELRVVYE